MATDERESVAAPDPDVPDGAGPEAAALGGPATDGQDWTLHERQLLREWRNRAYASQAAYFSKASALLICSYLLGIPVVIVTTVVGTTIFANQDPSTSVPAAAGVLSVIAAVLASLQTFLRLGEKGAFNAVAGNAYSAIRREIEQLLAVTPLDPSNRAQSIEDIRKKMNQAGDTAPPIGQTRWERYARRFRVTEPPPVDTASQRIWNRIAPRRFREPTSATPETATAEPKAGVAPR